MDRRRRCLIAAVIATAGCSEQPARQAWGIVVSIAPRSQPKYDPDGLIVTVRSPDGVVGMKRVDASRLACRVGDTVRVTVRGINLTPAASACERGAL